MKLVLCVNAVIVVVESVSDTFDTTKHLVVLEYNVLYSFRVGIAMYDDVYRGQCQHLSYNQPIYFVPYSYRVVVTQYTRYILNLCHFIVPVNVYGLMLEAHSICE